MIENKEIKNVSVEDIIPNRFQPRLSFGEKELNELSDSIKQHGVIQPLLLRQIGDKYEIIAGERRYKASCLAGLNNVPAIIIETDDNTSAEIAIIENIQRKDLSAIEEAQSYKKLIDRGNTQEEIAKKVGIGQSTVANKIRLLALTEEVQEALLNNQISERHARSLLKLTNNDEQIELLNRIISEKMTVKQTEEIIANKLGNNPIEENNIVENIENSLVTFEKEDSQQEENFVEPMIIEEIQEIQPEELTSFSDLNDKSLEQVPAEQPIEELFYPQEILDIDERIEEQVLRDNDEESTQSVESAITKTRELMEELKSSGHNISSEEYDLGDIFEIVIKIKKENN